MLDFLSRLSQALPMSQTNKISKNNTAIVTNRDGSVSIILYSTEILRHWPEDRKVRIDTGGFYTATTRTRLAQAFSEWNIPLNASFRKDKREIFNYKTNESFGFSKDDICYVSY